MSDFSVLVRRLLHELDLVRHQLVHIEAASMELVASKTQAPSAKALAGIQGIDSGVQAIDGICRFLMQVDLDSDLRGDIDFEGSSRDLSLFDMRARLSGMADEGKPGSTIDVFRT